LISLTDEQLKAIGRIAVAFASIEELVPFLQVLLTGADPRTAWKVRPGYQESITRELEELRASCRKLTPDPLVSAVDSWVDRAFIARDRRVEVMHSPWTSRNPWAESDELTKIRYGRNGRLRYKTFTTETLNRIADHLEGLHEEG
jgi:hypothetical protein